ncbi:hypothetical protein HQ545_03685 [Candidatus Woesearchaeota archaeon]|nr:hypothetical protein [Candidatus Woesearchaeota archaeon]
MLKKTGVVIILILSLLLAGCSTLEKCEEPLVKIDSTCCIDQDNNNECDIPLCSNNVCDESENCSSCWQDCGACKRIVYVYVPRNFTLGELSANINSLEDGDIKFRKDIDALNEVSNFFYFNDKTPRYFADLMGTKYKYITPSRSIVLNHITNEAYNVNSSVSLKGYVDYANWYLTYSVRNEEIESYEKRISSGKATEDYPTQPTGYQKTQRYADWEFKKYSKDEEVMIENIDIIGDGIVESIYSSITDYDITYKIGEYSENDEDDIVKEEFKQVEEIRLSYIHSVSLICARNLVITLYDFGFNGDYCTINKECIDIAVKENRLKLLKRAQSIKAMCDQKYSDEIFTY